MTRLVRFLSYVFGMIILLFSLVGMFFYMSAYTDSNYPTENISSTQTAENTVMDAVEVTSVSNNMYVYQTLDDREKVVYDQVYDCITNFKEKITVSTTDTEVLDKVYKAIMADYGNLYWQDGYKYNIHKSGEKIVYLEFLPNYTMTESKKEHYQRQIDEVVSEWLSSIDDTASDYDKALYVFETLINKVEYNENSNQNQNIISTFLYRSTVCKGYANGAWYLLDKLGIKSTIITGMANGESHAWNLVQLDGSYYYMDVTWGNSRYLDKGNYAAKRINYAYFAMTSEEIEKNHYADVFFTVPDCTATQCNYFVHEGLYYTEYNADDIGAKLKQSYEAGNKTISLMFETEDSFNETLEYFFDENNITRYCSGLKSVYYLVDTNTNVLTVMWQ